MNGNSLARSPFAARAPELSADEPHPAPLRDAVHGLVQPHRAAARARLSLAVWQAFGGDLRLDEAERDRLQEHARVLHARLKPGARPIDPRSALVVSPCDAIVGAHGAIRGTEVFQAKGFPYTLEELLGDAGSSRNTATACSRRCGCARTCITGSTRPATRACARSSTSRATRGTSTRSR